MNALAILAVAFFTGKAAMSRSKFYRRNAAGVLIFRTWWGSVLFRTADRVLFSAAGFCFVIAAALMLWIAIAGPHALGVPPA